MPPLRRIFQKTSDESGKSRFTIAFSTPLLIACALVLICAVAWAFIMGLMVGKGQNPQAQLSHITGGILSAKEKDSPEPALEAEEPIPAPREPISDTPATVAQTHAPKVQAHPFVKPEGAGLGAWGDGAARENTATRPPAREKNRKADTSGTYEYIFQVSAFKSQKEADTLRKKLAAKGIRCQTRKSGKVTLVTASVRGGEKEADSLRQKIQAQRLGKPLLLSKKPLNQPPQRKPKGKGK